MVTEVDLQGLVERVHRLECQNRRWKFATVFLLCVAASLLATGLVAQERIEPPLVRAKAVEAQSFVLKDPDGNIREQLRMKGSQPSIEIYDQGGKVLWSAPVKAEMVPAR